MSGPVTPAPARARIESVDLLRGVIMILMALDHTRDYFGAPVNPTDVATTTVALFFTRWVTHFCAPVFFLLTGTGAFLALRRRSVAGLSRFLLTRGLWLIFLELVVVRCLGWQFNFDWHLTVLTVLWALGWAMIVLSALVWLPAGVVGTIGAALILVHNLFDGVRADSLGAFAPLWTALHAPGVLWTDGIHTVFAAYVLIPWVGVTAVGYSLGQVYRWEPERRRRFLLRLGIALVVAFLALRAVNIYGDPSRWAHQRSGVFTALSFINTTKYPPSLLYLLMTLGPALLFLRAVDGRLPRALRPALAFGKVPMFYYVLHIVLIHLLAVGACLVRYGSVHWMFESPTLDRYPVTQPPGWPAPLPVVWLIWVMVVLLLYPLCRWFAGVKRRRTEWWLSYL
ncbi:MAG TPA: heparan-alpha-glucosaminide N-acetyltransferase domain-containing protein [Gemmatimonadaceae bacterium]|nr:heparan-alpha-glucosaminide N-acetyltransferase domain-containing protein [Gemmatimonadaceae bacterium]